MKSQIFIENATNINWNILDQQGHLVRRIKSNNIYSIQLQNNINFKCKSSKISFGFRIDDKGEINYNETNKFIGIYVTDIGHHGVFTLPPPLQYFGYDPKQNISADRCQYYGADLNSLIMSPYKCFVSRHLNNKMLITPKKQPNRRVIPHKSENILDHL